MATQTFTVTHADGSKSTRTSKTMTYTHAVEVLSTDWNKTEPTWGVLRWSQSQVNADKARAGFLKSVAQVPEWASARVVEVDQ